MVFEFYVCPHSGAFDSIVFKEKFTIVSLRIFEILETLSGAPIWPFLACFHLNSLFLC